MNADVAHQALDCSSCHGGHRFDTQYAAFEACIKCHNDEHSQAFANSKHHDLWQQEITGDLPAGYGVSCATCHMPRCSIDGETVAQHTQNDNLRPNEKMIRSVCNQCHGVEFSISSLADSDLIKNCFGDSPATVNESVQLATDWFEAKKRKQLERKKRRDQQNKQKSTAQDDA